MSRFQSFDDATSPAQGTARIPRLRAELAGRGLGGFVVPRADEHQGEYVPPSAERLSWLTGFTGSAGTAVVLAEAAALVVDGRYTLQGAAQVDTTLLAIVPSVRTSVEDWIAANLPPGAVLGYDPALHTRKGVDALRRAAEKAGGRLEPVAGNPLDAVWTDRPPPPNAPVRLHPAAIAGEEAAAKVGRTQAALAEAGVDGLLVSDPHNLAWLFNIRGGDVAGTPLALGYGFVPRDGRPTLFLDAARFEADAAAAARAVADLAPPDALAETLAGLAGRRIRFDAATASSALPASAEAAGATIDLGSDPITAMKAVKNEAEIAGIRAAHRRDAVAMIRFLHWLDEAAPGGTVTEIAAAERLEAFRAADPALRDLAFTTIAGSGPNGAIVHYRVTRSTDRTLRSGELFLCDSGAQYADGTTDITRTVAIGDPTAEMRERFTRVLRGHIAIATAVFPPGTSGAQIDALARRPLWEAGLDFDHGTGHGVGAYLSVHEGPQRISKLGHAALEPGMLVSNEPGYYKEGAYGIRIENLCLCRADAVPKGERPMLGFETVTLVPIDRRLVDRAGMTADEIAWLDGYHGRVRTEIGPMLDGPARDWLDAATAPLG